MLHTKIEKNQWDWISLSVMGIMFGFFLTNKYGVAPKFIDEQ